MKWFTADLHIGHKNIITFCERPFTRADGQPDVDLMRQELGLRWDRVVKPGDEVYILGDLAFDADVAVDFLKNRPGQKFMVWGNHDPRHSKDRKKLLPCFVKAGDVLEVHGPDNTHIVCCHYPMLRWNRGHFGSWMLHGHTHGSLTGTLLEPPLRLVDVGVDVWNYAPVSFDELKASLSLIPPPGHHYHREL